MLMKAISAAAALCMIASPCVAAEFPDFQEAGARRSGVAGGVYVRLPLGRSAAASSAPQVGLRVSGIQDYRDARSGTAMVREVDAVDFRLAGSARPTLLIAGQPVERLARERLNLSTGATIAVAGGGLLLLVVIAAAAGGGGFGDTCPTVGGNRDHCIDP